MRLFLVLGLTIVVGALPAAGQTAPVEWRTAAAALMPRLDALELPAGAASPRPIGHELSAGYLLARKWRQHNNGNTENILAEYLAFVQACRTPGCAGDLIGGKGYLAWAQEVRADRARYGSAEAHVQAINDWLEKLAPAAGDDARRNLALFRADLDQAAADFATANIYSLGWLLARMRLDPPAQARAFARYGLFVYGQAWIGGTCLDIRQIAAVLDAPPKIETCR